MSGLAAQELRASTATHVNEFFGFVTPECEYRSVMTRPAFRRGEVEHQRNLSPWILAIAGASVSIIVKQG
jgi:hypothetical protein